MCPQAHRFNPDILKSYEGRERSKEKTGRRNRGKREEWRRKEGHSGSEEDWSNE